MLFTIVLPSKRARYCITPGPNPLLTGPAPKNARALRLLKLAAAFFCLRRYTRMSSWEPGALLACALFWSGDGAGRETDNVVPEAGLSSMRLKSSGENSAFAPSSTAAGKAGVGVALCGERTVCCPAMRRLAALICNGRPGNGRAEPCSLWLPKAECHLAARAWAMAGRIVSVSALPTIGPG